MDNSWNLQRFVLAQQSHYDDVLAELRTGHKRSHWMWFIFPQIKGLGHSEMARKFAIASLEEASAYLRHPLLGERLRECSALVAAIEGRTVGQIFGYPDDMKFHSSMTLFSEAGKSGDDEIFRRCLHKYFASLPDPATLAQLGR